ncbi:hypothetical protein ACMHYJ_07000 [Castellaniella hirudinis]|uniref:hypothetical protein n=1 Tax=Castellaniella hirudinis TaxID=1144617 RepID=UPI0039C1773B
MKPQYDEDTRKALESLRNSVAKALDRKRRLGQYAVVWKDGKSVYIGPNPPEPKEPTRSDTERR